MKGRYLVFGRDGPGGSQPARRRNGVGWHHRVVGGKPGGSDRREARIRILNTSDFDHLDPALAYFTHSWNWMGATQLRMYYYPYVAGAASERIAPMAAQGHAACLEQRQDVHDHDQAGLQVLERQNVTAASFKRAFDRAHEREAAVAGVVVPRRRGERSRAERRARWSINAQEGRAGLPRRASRCRSSRPCRRATRSTPRSTRASSPPARTRPGVEQEDVGSRGPQPAVEEQARSRGSRSASRTTSTASRAAASAATWRRIGSSARTTRPTPVASRPRRPRSSPTSTA